MRVFFVSVFLLTGCAAEPGAARAPLVMGDPDSGDPAVVAIRNGTMLCTGTLVAPDVVVTAAHCALAVPEAVVFGDTSTGGTSIAVTSAIPDPDFDRVTFAHDVAVLLLASDAPSAPVPMLDGSATLTAGATVRIVGFGAVDDTGAGAGQKRTGSASIESVDESAFAIAPAPSQPCEGDSGGPTFVTVGGRELLAGIHSGGDPHCVGGSREMRVDAHRAFIDPYLHRGGCSASGGPDAGLATPLGALLLLARRRRQIRIVSQPSATST